MKVYIAMVSYDTSDDRGNEILGVYRELKDATEIARQEADNWKENFSCNDSVTMETDNVSWWCFDDRMENYVEINVMEKECF